jgi:hypothetical protein
MIATALVVVIVLGWLLAAFARSVRDERSPHRSVLREFGLAIVLFTLFLITWVAQLVTQWQTFTDEQRSHGESAELGDFVAEFGQSTMENWQSEFLQLFSFVVLAALYIHKGSGESKDSDENMEASLRRIEEHLGTLPASAPHEPGEEWRLPESALEAQDARTRRTEPTA